MAVPTIAMHQAWMACGVTKKCCTLCPIVASCYFPCEQEPHLSAVDKCIHDNFDDC